MAAVRFVRIENFRGIASLAWAPHEGINAVIGPGDSGKSTVQEALDLVLGSRRSGFTDADFHCSDTSKPIVIDVTVGDLPKELRDLEAYSRVIRGWLDASDDIADEPLDGYEPVLTLRLMVNADCEPTWCLYSERFAASDLVRDMKSGHRALISAQRLGASVAPHLAWGPRSVLSRLCDGNTGTAGVLARATRAAQGEFEAGGAAELKPAVDAARGVAREMAVARALDAEAALDARAVNMASGAIALHAGGVPLCALGTGSGRLMAAGLQAKAAQKVPVLLMDEAEHGLEPHRIVRLLHQLGSKASKPVQQVFLTTHSPVVLRELSARQLWIARLEKGEIELRDAARFGEAQGLLRGHPDAFLSPAVLVCEGLTEQGLVRGLDLSETEQGRPSLALMGIALVTGVGIPQAARVALGLARLGFRVALLRDSDKTSPEHETPFLSAGGGVFCWKEGFATEDQLFASVPADALPALLRIADNHHTAERVASHLGAHGLKREGVAAVRAEPEGHRRDLAKAARSGEWFKRIDFGEDVGRLVVGPELHRCAGELRSTIEALWRWFAANGDGHGDG